MGTISKGILGPFSGRICTVVGSVWKTSKKMASDKDYHRPWFRVRVACAYAPGFGPWLSAFSGVKKGIQQPVIHLAAHVKQRVRAGLRCFLYIF
jgi:hypothetical protein